MINRFITDAIFRHRNPSFAVLPYNLNWMLSKRVIRILRDADLAPITVVDVGCRGGLPDELFPIRKMVHHIGFDADAQECDRMNSEPHDLHSRNIFPVFVGSQDGESDFNLFKSRAESSALPPDERFAALFGGRNFAVEKTTKVKTTTLDSFFQSHPTIPRPDMIKLDTQGTELEILKGAVECLRSSLLIEVEVEFLPMYQGQALFEDVLVFMRKKGFELLHLNRVFKQRKGYSGWAKGQIIFGDALFMRREDSLESLSDKSKLKYLTFLLNYGYRDIVQSILTNNDLPEEIRHLFSQCLRPPVGKKLIKRLQRYTIPLVDKLILVLLHARRHNALNTDSDRSWPFR